VTDPSPLWTMWDLFQRGGTADIIDTGIDGVEILPSGPRLSIGGGRVAIGPFVAFQVASRDVEASPAEVIAREISVGDVVGIASLGTDIAVMGSRLAVRALSSGASAVVTDGNLRDAGDFSRLPLVALANGTTPSGGQLPGTYLRSADPASMFGTQWHPGDWFAQDADGALRLTPDSVRAVAAKLGRPFTR
jgi:regulator of RNase E activity RraA